MTTLHDRLAALAEGAPTDLPDGLWDRGQRYRRRRALSTAAVVVVSVLLAGTVGLAGWQYVEDAGPTPSGPTFDDVPFEALHLPRTLYRPSTWADGSAEAGPPGPLAMVGLADRSVIRDGRAVVEAWHSYGISAVDGSIHFLDLPGNNVPESGVQPVVSPDGRKVAYARHGDEPTFTPCCPSESRLPVVGWAVYDTVTGEVVELDDPGVARPVPYEISFSGDSRHLVATYVRQTRRGGSNTHYFTSWDVSTGAPTTVETPREGWVPNLGRAPHEIVWSRRQVSYALDPSTGARREVTVPQQVAAASWGPDGTAFAYLGYRDNGPNKPSRWRLFVGRDAASAPSREVTSLDFEPGMILGWRDASTVVVVAYRGPISLVDVRTGKATPAGAELSGEWVTYASAMWANDLVDGTRPPNIRDPRIKTRLALLVFALVPVLVFLVRRRRHVRA